MGDICLQPVAIQGPLFRVICCFCMYVSPVSNCHAGWSYVSRVTRDETLNSSNFRKNTAAKLIHLFAISKLLRGLKSPLLH